MLRKNIAPVMATILSALLFIIIGSCFSAFLYQKEIIKVKDPQIIKASNIVVYDKNGEEEINILKLSKLKLGLKPATGEEDKETNIPSTITEKKGGEGHYVKFQLYAPDGAKIYVTEIVVQGKKPEDKIQEERKNIMVAIKEIDQSANSLESDKVFLGEVSESEGKVQMTLYVWLSGKASDVLESSTISFKVSFEN